MMQLLGLNLAGNNQESQGAPTKRLGFGQTLLIGGGCVGGGTIVLSAIEIIRSEPEKAFKLLHDWGPWFFLAMLIVWVLGGIMNRALSIAERVGDRMAGSLESVAEQQQSLAEAARVQADALKVASEKDDREKQEMQVLIGVVNSKVDQMGRNVDRILETLKANRAGETGQ